MTRSYPRIRHYDENSGSAVLVTREVIRLVLHLPFNHHALARPIQAALDMYLDSVGTGSDIFSECSLGYEPSALHEDSWSNLRQMLATSGEESFLDDEEDQHLVLMQMKGQFDRRVELSSEERGVTGYGFFYGARLPWRTPPKDQVSLASFSWPTEYLEAHGSAHMRQEVMNLAALLPYASGHAGLAFSSPNVWGPSVKDIQEEMLRHPGLDVTHGHLDLGSCVDGVHWLNFLGPEVLSRIGGVDMLRSRLGASPITLTPLEGGRALVLLGDEPDAGDLSGGNVLPAYRELARVLEPWFFPMPTRVSWRGCPSDMASRWWRRFLEP